MAPTSIDGTEITGATIDGQDVSEITVDGETVFTAIPDSEADQKLIHRWALSQDSDPFVDEIGSADGTNNGTTQVSGDWIGGAAREGKDTDAYIDTSPLGNFGSSMDTDFAVAFSFQYQNQGDRESFFGVLDGNMGLEIGDSIFGDVGKPEFLLRDNDGGSISVFTDSTFDDGGEHRCVMNKTGNSETDLEIWIDQQQRNVSIGGSSAFDSVVNFSRPLYLCANNFDGSVVNAYSGVLDDVCIFNDSLTQSEIQSYSNPWV